MKPNRIIVWALTLLGGAFVAKADLTDIAFYSSNFPATRPTGAAVLGQTGDIWNWMDAGNPDTSTVYGPFAINDVFGNPSGVLDYTADGGVISTITGTQPDPDLTNTYLYDNQGGSINVTLSGLPAFEHYLLVLYVSSDDAAGGDRSLAGTVNGLAFSATGDPQAGFVNGENVVELNVVSNADGRISITENEGIGNTAGEVDLNGLQLESGVPEPSSLGLLFSCIGGFALLAWRRERRGRTLTA